MLKGQKFFAILVILSLMIPLSTFAQSSGKIDGYVKDKKTGDPLPGANVVIKGTTLGAATSTDGYYYIINVPPGTYTLTASMMGYTTLSKQEVQIIVDLTTKIDFQLEETVLDVGEEIVVTAERPLIETDLTSKVSTLTYEEIKNLPAEDMTRVLALQSNITVLTNTPYAKSGYNLRGIEDIRMRGGRNNELGLFIDGMKVGNPLFGGFGTRINNNAINQMTVAAGGFSPEYGNALSGVINISTREGGSKLTGLLEYGTSAPFGIDWLTNQHGRERNYQNVQFSLSGPVPLIRNLTFFFSTDLSSQAGSVYQLDDQIWDEHNYIILEDGTRKQLPSSAELINDFIEDGLVDLITQDEVESVMTSRKVGGMYRWINPLDNIKGWHGMGWNNDVDYLAKLTYRLNPNMKLSLSLSQSQSYSQSNISDAHFYYTLPGTWNNIDIDPVDVREDIPRLLVCDSCGARIELKANELTPAVCPECSGSFQVWHRNSSGMAGRNVRINTSSRQNIIWNHTLSPATFYTIRFQRFFESRRVRVLGFYDDKYGEILGIKNIFAPDWDNIRQKIQYDHRGTYAVYDPWESYFYMRWNDQYFSGDSSVTYDMRLDFTSQVTRNHQLKFGGQFIYMEVFRHDDQSYYGLTDYPTVYHMYPKEGALYIMDKIEYGTVVINVGGRMDYSNAGGEMWLDPLNPLSPVQDLSTVELEYNEWETGKKKFKFSPRIGMAFPLTSMSVMHFNFGHFYQQANYRDMYRASGSLREVSLKGGNIIGNPSLEPEKSIQYEIGFQQQIGELYGIDIRLWSKETTNQVGSIYVPAMSDPTHSNPYDYSVFLNNNFGSAKGVDIQIQKRYSHYFSGTINYTWAQAKVLKQTSWDSYWDGDTKQTMPKREVTADWDQPHSIRAYLNFSIPSGAGPTLWGNKVLSNTGVSLIYFGESGRVYTPYMGEEGFLEKENSARWPFYHQFDLRAYKNFRAFGLTYSIFTSIRNIFDRKNVIDGYSRTGSPTDPGGIYTTYSATYMDGISVNNFGPRRSINFGLRILW